MYRKASGDHALVLRGIRANSVIKLADRKGNHRRTQGIGQAPDAPDLALNDFVPQFTIVPNGFPAVQSAIFGPASGRRRENRRGKAFPMHEAHRPRP